MTAPTLARYELVPVAGVPPCPDWCTDCLGNDMLIDGIRHPGALSHRGTLTETSIPDRDGDLVRVALVIERIDYADEPSAEQVVLEVGKTVTLQPTAELLAWLTAAVATAKTHET